MWEGSVSPQVSPRSNAPFATEHYLGSCLWHHSPDGKRHEAGALLAPLRRLLLDTYLDLVGGGVRMDFVCRVLHQRLL